MPVMHGSKTRLYINGRDISRLFREAEAGKSREIVDTTAFAATADTHIPAPASVGNISAEGMLEVDPATGARPVQNALEAAHRKLDGANIVTMMMSDEAVGDHGFTLEGSVNEHAVQSVVADVAKTNLASQSNQCAWVRSLHPMAARLGGAMPFSGTAVDNTALTSFGGLASLHVSAMTGTTPVLTAKLQHSADNSTWVDLATFASINTAGVTAGYGDAVRVPVGTVNRYTRILVSVASGSLTSITFAAQFGRYTANQ